LTTVINGKRNSTGSPVFRIYALGDKELGDAGWVRLVLTDLDAALTFLAVAEAAGSDEIMRRNRENARTAFDSVLRLLPDLQPTEGEQRTIDNKLTLLMTRLRTAGHKL